MAGFLFDSVVFGPVHSRRLGISLGVNLLPTQYKYCSFNCIYCECGWTKIEKIDKIEFPPAILVRQFLEKKLREMQERHSRPEAISFAGNGEPTLHPEFAEVIDYTIELRNKYFPKSKIAVLSNSTMLHLPEVVSALKKIDLNILKLDAGTEETYRAINNPQSEISLNEIINNLKQFQSKLIIQTLFVRGDYNGKIIDNTTDEEVNLWLGHLKEIKPERIMIYPIARATPVHGLEKIGLNEMNAIAKRVKKIGLTAEVYY